MSDAGELLRWVVALTIYPFFLIDDLIHHGEEERWLREQEQHFQDMAKGQKPN